jgi:hypothetical protein
MLLRACSARSWLKVIRWTPCLLTIAHALSSGQPFTASQTQRLMVFSYTTVVVPLVGYDPTSAILKIATFSIYAHKGEQSFTEITLLRMHPKRLAYRKFISFVIVLVFILRNEQRYNLGSLASTLHRHPFYDVKLYLADQYLSPR